MQKRRVQIFMTFWSRYTRAVKKLLLPVMKSDHQKSMAASFSFRSRRRALCLVECCYGTRQLPNCAFNSRHCPRRCFQKQHLWVPDKFNTLELSNALRCHATSFSLLIHLEVAALLFNPLSQLGSDRVISWHAAVTELCLEFTQCNPLPELGVGSVLW